MRRLLSSVRLQQQPIAVADGDVQRAVRAEQQLAAHVAAVLPRVGDEDLLEVRELLAVERAAADREGRAALAAERIGDVDAFVLCEARVERNPLHRVVVLR